MPNLALVTKWPTPTAQPSVQHGAATERWCAQSQAELPLRRAPVGTGSVCECLPAGNVGTSLEGAPAANGGVSLPGKKFGFFAKACHHLPKHRAALSPMLVFGSCLLSSAAEKFPLVLAKERKPWAGAWRPPELEGKQLRCPGCFGSVTRCATRVLSSHGNGNTTLDVQIHFLLARAGVCSQPRGAGAAEAEGMEELRAVQAGSAAQPLEAGSDGMREPV